MRSRSEKLQRFNQMSSSQAWQEFASELNEELERRVNSLKRSDGIPLYRHQGAVDNLDWLKNYEKRLQTQASPDESSDEGASEDTPSRS